MRTVVIDALTSAESDDLLTTGEAAKLLNTSRQHVVDLCNSGDLPFTTTGRHRRVKRADVEALRTRTQRLTRDQLRSLWLNHAVAGKLVADPERILDLARRNLARMRAANSRGQARRWLDVWETLLEGSIEDVMEALTSRSPRARELRQNSPFAGVLDEAERAQVLSRYAAARHATSTR